MAENPYEDRFPVNRTLPEQGRPREEVLAELAHDGEEEDAFWETRQVLRARCTAATTSTTSS